MRGTWVLLSFYAAVFGTFLGAHGVHSMLCGETPSTLEHLAKTTVLLAVGAYAFLILFSANPNSREG